MNKRQVCIFPNLEELSRAAAKRFVELASSTLQTKAFFYAALSGGSTPRRLHELLATDEFSRLIPWARVRLFQVDERCVPPDHAESNYRMIREALLGRAPIAAASFHRIRAELPDRDTVARVYAEELARVLQPKAEEWPRFDLVFLGMGADGHTASLFPGTSALAEARLWVRASFVEKLGMHRVTLTLPVLNAAAHVIFLVSGAEKARTLREGLEGPPRATPFPAQMVKPVSGELSWYVDKAAAQLLGSAARSGT